MLVQEAFRTLKFLVSTMLEKHGIGELSKHFIIRKNIFFGVQILRKVRQDNGESRSEIIEKNIWLLSAIIFIVILLGGIYLRLDKVNMDSVKKLRYVFNMGILMR